MLSKIRIAQWTAWMVRATACLGVAASVGCTLEDAPGPGAIDEEEVDFRDNDCGAGLCTGKAQQTCKYTLKDDKWMSTIGTCKGSEKLSCEFRYTGCYFAVTASQPTCYSTPAEKCPAGPKVAAQTKTIVFDLAKDDFGTMVCEPAKPTPSSTEYKCNKLLDKKPELKAAMMKEFADTCAAKTTPDVVQDVTCCVKIAPGACIKPTAGDEGSACDGAGESTGGSSGWMSSSVTGDDAGTSGGGGSGGSDSSGGDPGACPEGTSMQCSGGDGPLMCACAAVPPPAP